MLLNPHHISLATKTCNPVRRDDPSHYVSIIQIDILNGDEQGKKRDIPQLKEVPRFFDLLRTRYITPNLTLAPQQSPLLFFTTIASHSDHSYRRHPYEREKTATPQQHC
jgi:hypothetical protein